MDVVLRTHDDTKYVGFHGIERYSDASGYCADLVVRSGEFTGRVKFCFEPAPLAGFVDDLEVMDRTLVGEATLRPLYEETFIKLEVRRTGAVRVSGELVRYAEHTHRLQFGFVTDQTCLAPLIRDLRAGMFAPAV